MGRSHGCPRLPHEFLLSSVKRGLRLHFFWCMDDTMRLHSEGDLLIYRHRNYGVATYTMSTYSIHNDLSKKQVLSEGRLCENQDILWINTEELLCRFLVERAAWTW